MGIDLEWEIGDEQAPPAFVEDPQEDGRQAIKDGLSIKVLNGVSGEIVITSGRPKRRHWRALALTAFIFGVIVLAALWLIQEQWRRRLEGELRSTIVLEAQALARGDREIFLKLQDPQDEEWLRTQSELLNQARQANIPADQTEIRALGVEGDWAWAEVRALRPVESLFRVGAPKAGEVTWLEQVQFYRRMDDRWKHVAPSADFLAYWGEAVTLEAPYLHVEFHERDRPQVEAWLAVLGPYTQEVCLDLGCPPEMKLTVALSPTVSLWESLQMLENPEAIRITLPSPHVIGIRQDHSLNEAPLFLAFNFSAMAVARSGGDTLFFDGGDGRRNPPSRVLLARAVFYRQLDRASSTLAVPAFQTAWTEFKHMLMDPLLRGEWLPLAQFDTFPSRRMSDERLPEGQAWMLVEYVAQTYGREHIGALLRAAQSSSSLAEALRLGLAVSDMSAFERDWQRFVAARLGQAMEGLPLRP